MSQIDRVNKSFTDFLLTSQGSDSQHTYNRYSGGHKKKSGPFISGYWYLLIELPELKLKTSDNTKIANLFTTDPESRNSMIRYLHATAESFTPPSKTIQKGEVSAFGGIKKYVSAPLKFV